MTLSRTISIPMFWARKEEAFLEGVFVTNNSPEFRGIYVIPIFLPVPQLLFNHPNVGDE